MSSIQAGATIATPPDTRASAKVWASQKERSLALCLLLVAVTLAFYCPVFYNGFTNYDDNGYVTQNPHVRAGLTPETIKWAFTSSEQANWHPLTWLSHELDYSLFGLRPEGHHVINLLLHAANVVLLFVLLQSATRRTWSSLIVAALFALHPVNVESVAWIAERKNVLSMLFFLLALLAYGNYARKPRIGPYLVVLLLFALGLMSKPQVITLPCVLLLWDYWPLRRVGDGWSKSNEPQQSHRKLWLVLEKVPLLLLSAASALITMKAQSAVRQAAIHSWSWPLRLENGVVGYVRYLGKALWPSGLAAIYPYPEKGIPYWQVYAAALLLALITGLVVWKREHRYLAVGWFWFLGTLVPMIGLVQVGQQAMADRYAYLPFIGLFLMLVWGVGGWKLSEGSARTWIAIPVTLWVITLGAMTYRQAGYWHDSSTLWLHTLQVTQNNYVAHDNLGAFFNEQGRADEAVAQFRAAVQIRGDDLPANLNIGVYEHGHGNLQAAIDRYQFVARLAADRELQATAYGNMGSAYRQLGYAAEAKRCYEASLQLVPNAPVALVGLGLIAQAQGDAAEAVRWYSQAMAVQPTDVGYVLLARALQQGGFPAESQAAYRLATRMSSDMKETEKEVDDLIAGR